MALIHKGEWQQNKDRPKSTHPRCRRHRLRPIRFRPSKGERYRSSSRSRVHDCLYFKQDDLLIRLFEERINPVINQLDDHVTSSGDDPRGQLMALVEGYLAGVGDDPKMATLITKQVRQSHEFMTSYSNDL